MPENPMSSRYRCLRCDHRQYDTGAFSFAAHRNNWGPLVVHTDTRVVRGRDTVVRGGLHCDS